VIFGAKKHWIFPNLWCVRTGRGEGEPVLTRRGSIFSILCGCLLWSANFKIHVQLFYVANEIFCR